MSKTKISKAKTERTRKEWPLVVYVWIFGLGIFGYIFARFAFETYPHPLHWVAGLASGLLGVLIGWAWYRWKGDIL